jgi:hypothetical protein
MSLETGNTLQQEQDFALAGERDQPSEAAALQSTVLTMLADMRSVMQSMNGRIANLEGDGTQSVRHTSHTPKGKGKAPLRRSAGGDGATPGSSRDIVDREDRESSVAASETSTRSKNWADRDDEVMDYSTELTWDDEDEESSETKGVKLFKVGEKTEKFINAAFATAATNTVRRQWRDKYGAPNTTATACPNLDKVIKGRLPAATKSRDRQLAKMQALTLDAVGPITHILEEAVKGQLTQKGAIEAAQTALRLLSNASVHSCRERRKNALQSMNARLLDMADDDAIFKSAPPLLFGDGFCKKAKERDEELKCLNAATTKSSGGLGGNQFFRGGRSNNQQPRGSGQNFRGRRGGYQRQHPYRLPQRQWSKGQNHKKTENSQ